jgi:hypothetical protein
MVKGGLVGHMHFCTYLFRSVDCKKGGMVATITSIIGWQAIMVGANVSALYKMLCRMLANGIDNDQQT